MSQKFLLSIEAEIDGEDYALNDALQEIESVISELRGIGAVKKATLRIPQETVIEL
jgi:hypothetical protein